MKKQTALYTVALVALSLASPAMAQTAVPMQGQPMHVQPGNDHRREIAEGIHKIEHAYDHLAKAGDDWGGHRAAAMQDLENAKHELEVALQFENQQMHR